MAKVEKSRVAADKKKSAAAYAAHKVQTAKRQKEISTQGRDIGAIPPVGNPRRRARARKSLKAFCKYFPETFYLKWSPDHLTVIARMEECIKSGGLFAMAMPRGTGKTSLCEVASLWGVMEGYHEFVALIGAELGSATDMLDSMKSELEQNEMLLEDYPEICFPIHHLEGIFQRAGGQTHNGKLTHIHWTAHEVVLPTIEGSKASGGIVRVAGLAGRIRGMKFKRPDGKPARPSLVILDDPQTDESARSPVQISQRLELINGAILGLAGPGHKICGIMPCTVIYPDDMADKILNRDVYPTWQGERTKLVYQFPDNMELWEEYVEIRNASLKSKGDGTVATKFYRRNRKAMDKGAVLAWPQRFDPGEISALQYAMNILHRDEGGRRAFYAEYQNDPLPPENLTGATRIEKEVILSKVTGRLRGVVPDGTSWLTSFVDVQGEAMYWMVCAWEANFTGAIIDYGTWPEQTKDYYLLSHLPRKMSDAVKGAGLEGRLYEGLRRVADKWLSHQWPIEGGSDVAKVDRALFDANWGQSTDTVYRFSREHALGAILMPTHGRFFGAGSIPMGDQPKKPGDIKGLNWIIPGRSRQRRTRYGLFDTNFWKSFVRDRLSTHMGDTGSLTLFGESDSHGLLVDHLGSEFCIRTEGRGRTVEEWKADGKMPDNHWLDCLVGCAVGASMLGAELFKTEPKKVRTLLKLSEIRKKKRVGA